MNWCVVILSRFYVKLKLMLSNLLHKNLECHCFNTKWSQGFFVCPLTSALIWGYDLSLRRRLELHLKSTIAEYTPLTENLLCIEYCKSFFRHSLPCLTEKYWRISKVDAIKQYYRPTEAEAFCQLLWRIKTVRRSEKGQSFLLCPVGGFRLIPQNKGNFY